MTSAQERAVLRKFIVNHYNDGELWDLCQDHFDEVYHKFASSMTLDDKVRVLVDYCRRHNRLGELRDIVAADRADAYSNMMDHIAQQASNAQPKSSQNLPKVDTGYLALSKSDSTKSRGVYLKDLVEHHLSLDKRATNTLLVGVIVLAFILIVTITINVFRNPKSQSTPTPTIPVLHGSSPVQIRIKAGEAQSFVTDGATPEPLLISVNRCAVAMYCDIQVSSRFAMEPVTLAIFDCMIVEPFYVAVADIYWGGFLGSEPYVTIIAAQISDGFDAQTCIIKATPTPQFP